jgi:hypothetical protein
VKSGGFMPMTFNTLLKGFTLSDVRLLRHKDSRSAKGRTPYELWRDQRPLFEKYQSTQGTKNEAKLNAPYWASFLGTPADETLFAGLYGVSNKRLLDHDEPMPHADGIDLAQSCHIYDTVLQEPLRELIGRLVIDWGPGDRSWVQRADNQDKVILELRTAFKEPEFPGFLQFIKPLSEIGRLPPTWAAALKAGRGVYLLTCPRTKEQYVGAAYGDGGFWNRFCEYLETGHGGNVVLKSREPSDYQVSILEVAGSEQDLFAMEAMWKRRLLTREMGLNGN